MGYTLNTMEKPCVHKDHGGVKDKEPRTVLEPYIYTRTKPRTKSKAHQEPSKTTSPCRRLRCTDVHACHLFQSKGQEPRMQAHGACASSHMVRWHRHVCSIYTKLRNQNVMCFGSKVQAPWPTACCKAFRTARRRRMCIAWRYCCSSESSSNGPSGS